MGTIIDSDPVRPFYPGIRFKVHFVRTGRLILQTTDPINDLLEVPILYGVLK